MTAEVSSVDPSGVRRPANHPGTGRPPVAGGWSAGAGPRDADTRRSRADRRHGSDPPRAADPWALRCAAGNRPATADSRDPDALGHRHGAANRHAEANSPAAEHSSTVPRQRAARTHPLVAACRSATDRSRTTDEPRLPRARAARIPWAATPHQTAQPHPDATDQPRAEDGRHAAHRSKVDQNPWAATPHPTAQAHPGARDRWRAANGIANHSRAARIRYAAHRDADAHRRAPRCRYALVHRRALGCHCAAEHPCARCLPGARDCSRAANGIANHSRAARIRYAAHRDAGAHRHAPSRYALVHRRALGCHCAAEHPCARGLPDAPRCRRAANSRIALGRRTARKSQQGWRLRSALNHRSAGAQAKRLCASGETRALGCHCAAELPGAAGRPIARVWGAAEARFALVRGTARELPRAPVRPCASGRRYTAAYPPVRRCASDRRYAAVCRPVRRSASGRPGAARPRAADVRRGRSRCEAARPGGWRSRCGVGWARSSGAAPANRRPGLGGRRWRNRCSWGIGRRGVWRGRGP
ncbi:hypothetical protein APR09_000412 [Nocardia amikacinitolerans]|nr:hypothetical protein [Nocardia amikacinitolerans]